MIDMDISPNSHGCPSYAFSYGNCIDIRGKSLSNDLTPTKLAERFEFNAKVLAARRDLEVRRFLSALPQDPTHLISVLKAIKNEQAPAALDRDRRVSCVCGDAGAG